MAPFTASDEHQNVVWRAHNRSERLLVRAVNPAWPVVLFILSPVHAVVFQLPQWLARRFPQVIFDVALAPVLFRDTRGMFRAQHHHGIAHDVKVIVPRALHGSGNAVEDLKWVTLGVIIDVVRRLAGKGRDGALL